MPRVVRSVRIWCGRLRALWLAAGMHAGTPGGMHFDVERRLQHLEDHTEYMRSEVQHLRKWVAGRASHCSTRRACVLLV